MKHMGKIYLVKSHSRLYLTYKLTYLSRGNYVFLHDKGGECVCERDFELISEENILKFVKNVHESIYLEKTTCQRFGEFYLEFGPGGVVTTEEDGAICVVSCPPNIFKEEYIKFVQKRDAYFVRPCTKDGKVLNRGTTSPRNAYTASCNSVYGSIRSHPRITTSELIELMDMPANSVTPRLTDLMRAGRIHSVGKKFNKDTMRYQSMWSVSDGI